MERYYFGRWVSLLSTKLFEFLMLQADKSQSAVQFNIQMQQDDPNSPWRLVGTTSGIAVVPQGAIEEAITPPASASSFEPTS